LARWAVMVGIARQLDMESTCQACISGMTDWQGQPAVSLAGQSYTITGSGTHTLKWRYTKNGSGTGGSDCAWVDYVQSPSPTDWLTITYGYDSAGRRIEKAYDGQTVCKYLYDGSHIIADYDGNGSLLHKYIYGPGVDQPICMIDVEHSSATYYYHFDGLGSVVALTSSSGSTVEVYEYSIFGEVSASDPNHPNRFLFTGREFDADTGLYYYRARYYNPYIGRFLQTDPAGDGMNAYAYCGNNSTNAIDPSGLRWEDPAVRIILYNSTSTYWWDFFTKGASSDPFWDIAIDISGKAAAAAGFSSSADYIKTFGNEGVLKGMIKAAIPTDPNTGQPLFDIDHQVTIEGLWIYDHGNAYGDTVTVPYDEAFMGIFAAIGAGLNDLDSAGAPIHLRTCTSGEEDAGLLMVAAASASGHSVTAPLGTLWLPPASGLIGASGLLGYAPWVCTEGFGIAVPTLNAAGAFYYPTSRYRGGPEIWQTVERITNAAPGITIKSLVFNKCTSTCVW